MASRCWLDSRMRPAASKHARVLELSDVTRAVLHGAAAVEQNGAPHGGLIGELSDVQTIRPAVYLPVDEPRVVARRVGPVLGELGRGTGVSTVLQTSAQGRDDGAGQKGEIVDGGQFGQIER